MDRSPGWDSYRSFLAVLGEGSLSGAARKLGLTQPTVGRHIQAIEAALGGPLFVRSQRGLTATPKALALKPYAEAIQSSAQALVRAASSRGQEAQGAVRISASDVIAAEVLPFILRPLNERHPGLSFEVEASNQVADLLHRAADVAVRMTRPVQQSLVAIKAGEIEIGLYATENYLTRRGRPRSLTDMAGHVLIGFDQETALVRRLNADFRLPPREAYALRTDSDLAALGAVRAGFGIGGCQAGVARREGWIRLLPDLFALRIEAWVVMHEDLKASSPCRLTFDALVEGLKAYIAGQST
jgi:DNA-binding transcriptional LysR family regulator